MGQVPGPPDGRRHECDFREISAQQSSCLIDSHSLLVRLEKDSLHGERLFDFAEYHAKHGSDAAGEFVAPACFQLVAALLSRVQEAGAFSQVYPKELTDLGNLGRPELLEQHRHREGKYPYEVGPELHDASPPKRLRERISLPEITR